MLSLEYNCQLCYASFTTPKIHLEWIYAVFFQYPDNINTQILDIINLAIQSHVAGMFFIISWAETQSSSMILRVCPRSAHNLEPRDRISDHREDEGGGYSTHRSHQQASPSVFIYTHTHTQESFLLLMRVGNNRMASNAIKQTPRFLILFKLWERQSQSCLLYVSGLTLLNLDLL